MTSLARLHFGASAALALPPATPPAKTPLKIHTPEITPQETAPPAESEPSGMTRIKQGSLWEQAYRYITNSPEKINAFTPGDIEWVNARRSLKQKFCVGSLVYTAIFGGPRFAIIEPIKGAAALMRRSSNPVINKVLEPVLRHAINAVDKVYRGIEFVGTMPFPDEGMLLYKEPGWLIMKDRKTGKIIDPRSLAVDKNGERCRDGKQYTTIIGGALGLMDAYPKNVPVDDEAASDRVAIAKQKG